MDIASKSRTLLSDVLLLLTAAIWGGGFVAQRIGMESLGPFTFNAIRFALGALSLLPLLLFGWGRSEKDPCRTFNGATPQVLFGAGLAGLALFMGAAFQQCGIVYTTAGNAGFITGLYMVIVPLLGLLFRHRPDRATWIGAAIALIGLYFLSVAEGFTVAFGDLLEFIGAFFWAAHVLILGWASPRMNPLLLAFLQFMVCATLSFITAIAVETITIGGIATAAVPILYGGIISVGVAYTLQVVAQRAAHPAHAAILLSMEAVFAAIYGWLLLGEVFSERRVLGCTLMLSGMLLSQFSAYISYQKRLRAVVTT
jgi:drug/metabolite transporter (DMT)-like permease